MAANERTAVVIQTVHRTTTSTTDNILDDDSSSKVKSINLASLAERYLKIRSRLVREFLGEVISTFILIAFGCGSVAQYTFMGVKHSNQIPFLSVNISWGFAVTLGILVAGKASGAHMNPAVSLALLITGKMSLVRFFLYLIGQFIGAFLGAAMVFLVYLDHFNSYKEGSKSMTLAGIFATYPTPTLSVFGGFFDQAFATALLVLVVLAVGDKRNVEIPHGTTAILLGLTVLIIGTSFGFNCGYAVNPIRDFAPRLFTAIAGWGSKPFTSGNHFFWIPIVGPFVGSIFGALIYVLCIGSHWPM